jgi:hypothetical protein
MPYTSHNATPRVKMENMPNDKSFAERDFQVLSTWGKNEMVVREAASKPNTLIPFIVLL